MKWFIQVYDEEGYPCKMLRTFKGTRKEVNQYVSDRFGLVDSLFDRTTLIFEKEEDVLEKIEVQE